MATYAIDDVRNLSIVGHAGAGKTSLCEAILHKAGVSNRLGSVDDGSSYLDTDDESKDRRQSIDSSFFNLEHRGKLINAFDTPGMPDYCGVAIASLAAVETAVVVVDAHAGIGVNTRRMYNAARDFGLARMVVINKIDTENVNLEEIFNAVRETFGNACQPINLPADGGKKVIDVLSSAQGASDLLDVGAAHTALVDAIVETDDALMEEYMEAGSLPPDRIKPAIAGAVAAGHLIPVLFTDAKGDVGIAEFLDALTTFAPSPAVGKQRQLVTGQGEDAQTTPIESARDGEFIAQVFKITSDPKSNIKYSFARVFRGSVTADAHLIIDDERKGQRPGHFLKFCGDEHEEVDTAAAGDVIALAKLDVHIGSMIREKPGQGTINLPKLPQPMFALAIQPKVRADIEKIGLAARRIAKTRDQGHKVVAVCSAMGDTTDDLIALAHQVAQRPDERELDALLATGEMASSALVAMALLGMGCPAVSLTGLQAGIQTQGGHGRARIAAVEPQRIVSELDAGKVAVVAGFQGVTEQQEVTTLGRGASDTTAVALAAALGA
ncbi:MAG: hypothetical protein IH986_12880, partial [Planctomycetes bacterium]|nr:hypothetical protein [Planctomycetota bacterium]